MFKLTADSKMACVNSGAALNVPVKNSARELESMRTSCSTTNTANKEDKEIKHMNRNHLHV